MYDVPSASLVTLRPLSRPLGRPLSPLSPNPYVYWTESDVRGDHLVGPLSGKFHSAPPFPSPLGTHEPSRSQIHQ